MAGAVLVSLAIAVAFGVAAWLSGERSTERIAEAAQSVPAAWITLFAAEAVTLVVALLACRIVAVRPQARLVLTSPGIGRMDAAVLVAATIVPFAGGLLTASVVPSFSSDSLTPGLTRMWSEGSRMTSVLWVLSIAVIPGLVEEAFYRGLVLRGFLLRWRPLTAILASSTLFAVAHVDPATAAFTFVVGVWFGVVAWRTGSVVLPILMHAGMNGSWTTIQMIAARSPVGDAAGTTAAAITVALGIGAFIWGVRILRRCDPCTPRAPAPFHARSRTLAFAGCAAGATAALLYAVIPPGEGKPSAAPPQVPSLASLRDLVTSTVDCPNQGEIEFELPRGGAVRVALPTNRIGVHEVIAALNDDGGLVWLAYNGEVTGKGFRLGIPLTGILEQLGAGDPTVICMRFESRPSGLAARFSLLQDQAAVDAAWARAASEDGWATRGRG